jgi:hypothetical protein
LEALKEIKKYRTKDTGEKRQLKKDVKEKDEEMSGQQCGRRQGSGG